MSFTATLSLVDSRQGFLYQIEFEFDGHKENAEPPSLDTILSSFEQMLFTICSFKINKVTTYTKLEWLLSLKNKSQNL